MRAPPVLDPDDPGVRWRREGAALVVERVPTVRGAVKPALIAAAFAGAAWLAWSRQELVVAIIFGACAPLMALGAWLLARQALALRLDSTGLSWEARRPRAFRGEWRRDHLGGLRLRRGAEPPGWGVARTWYVDARVQDRWVNLAQGHREPRARGLAEALAGTLAVPLAEVDDDPERDDVAN